MYGGSAADPLRPLRGNRPRHSKRWRGSRLTGPRELGKLSLGTQELSFAGVDIQNERSSARFIWLWGMTISLVANCAPSKFALVSGCPSPDPYETWPYLSEYLLLHLVAAQKLKTVSVHTSRTAEVCMFLAYLHAEYFKSRSRRSPSAFRIAWVSCLFAAFSARSINLKALWRAVWVKLGAFASVGADSAVQSPLNSSAASRISLAVTSPPLANCSAFCHAAIILCGDNHTNARTCDSFRTLTPIGAKISATVAASINRFAWVLLNSHFRRQYSSNVWNWSR